MSEKKPMPLLEPVTRPKCPICGTSVYSAHGIHPQCALLQADRKRLAANAVPKTKAVPKAAAANQQKKCPACYQITSAKTVKCQCGFQFAGM